MDETSCISKTIWLWCEIYRRLKNKGKNFLIYMRVTFIRYVILKGLSDEISCCSKKQDITTGTSQNEGKMLKSQSKVLVWRCKLNLTIWEYSRHEITVGDLWYTVEGGGVTFLLLSSVMECTCLDKKTTQNYFTVKSECHLYHSIYTVVLCLSEGVTYSTFAIDDNTLGRASQ